MSPHTAQNERDTLKVQVRFHRMMNMGLLAVLFLQLLLLGFVVLRNTTRIVPPEIKRPYEIGANYANKDYLLDMANYVLDKVLTVTPEAVEYNNGVILKMTHPDGHPTLQTVLDTAAQHIKRDHITTIWMPHKEEVSASTKQVRVSGKLKTYIADKLTSEREKEYLVQFIVTLSGRLYVLKIEEIIKKDSALYDGVQS
jgi:conjugal transfer pilus assembly protein TraE